MKISENQRNQVCRGHPCPTWPCWFFFKRKFAYHLISVYIPSLSLLLISLATLYISIDHFEANIMVHLTAMLVMYTLYQAISISLPKVLVL